MLRILIIQVPMSKCHKRRGVSKGGSQEFLERRGDSTQDQLGS